MADKPEVAAIEAAYRARVDTLFMGLVTNLGDQQGEQQSVDRVHERAQHCEAGQAIGPRCRGGRRASGRRRIARQENRKEVIRPRRAARRTG